MGKRKNKERDEEYIRKKIRKLEEKLGEIPKSAQQENNSTTEEAAKETEQEIPLGMWFLHNYQKIIFKRMGILGWIIPTKALILQRA